MYEYILSLLKANRPIGPCVTTHNFNTWFNIGVTSSVLAFVFKDVPMFASLANSMRWHAISTLGVIMLHQIHVREKLVWLLVGLGHNLFELSMGMHMVFGKSVVASALIPCALASWFAFELIVAGNQKTFEDTVDNIFFFSMFSHYPALAMMITSLLFDIQSGHSNGEKAQALVEHILHMIFEIYMFVHVIYRGNTTTYWRELFVLANACSCLVALQCW